MLDICKHYHLLGLEKGASVQEIKYAYRNMALKYHPDKSVSKQDEEKFKLINEAYHILRTDHKCGIGENMDIRKPSVGKSSNKYGLGSKIPFLCELYSNKILKEDWGRCAKYAEKAYRGFCKYEGEMWDSSEKAVKRTMMHIHLVSTQYPKTPLLFIPRVCVLIKKVWRTGLCLKNNM
jgi:hypothetical protein